MGLKPTDEFCNDALQITIISGLCASANKAGGLGIQVGHLFRG